MFEEHLSLFIRAPAAAAQDVATEWSNPVLLSPVHGYTSLSHFRLKLVQAILFFASNCRFQTQLVPKSFKNSNSSASLAQSKLHELRQRARAACFEQQADVFACCSALRNQSGFSVDPPSTGDAGSIYEPCRLRLNAAASSPQWLVSRWSPPTRNVRVTNHLCPHSRKVVYSHLAMAT